VSDRPPCYGKYGWRDGYESWQRNLVHRMKQRLGIDGDTPSPCINSCPFREACRRETFDRNLFEGDLGVYQGVGSQLYIRHYHDAKTQYAKEHPHVRALRNPDARDQTRTQARRDEARAAES